MIWAAEEQEGIEDLAAEEYVHDKVHIEHVHRAISIDAGAA